MQFIDQLSFVTTANDKLVLTNSKFANRVYNATETAPQIVIVTLKLDSDAPDRIVEEFKSCISGLTFCKDSLRLLNNERLEGKRKLSYCSVSHTAGHLLKEHLSSDERFSRVSETKFESYMYVSSEPFKLEATPSPLKQMPNKPVAPLTETEIKKQ